MLGLFPHSGGTTHTKVFYSPTESSDFMTFEMGKNNYTLRCSDITRNILLH